MLTRFLPAFLFLASFSSAKAGIILTTFPVSDFNANSSTMNATLGITGFQINSFETLPLSFGVTYTLDAGAPQSSLPALFDTTLSPLTANNQWDGTDVASNAPSNGIKDGTYATLITFNIAGGTGAFGLGLSNFQSLSTPSGQFPISDHDLIVNGVDLGTIESLAGANWTPGLGRSAYIVLTTNSGSTINSVGFQVNTPGTTGDLLLFDHLAIAPAASAVPEPSTLAMFAAGAVLAGLTRWKRSQA